MNATGRLYSGVAWAIGSAVIVAAVNYAYSIGLAFALSSHSYSAFAAGQALLLVAGTIAGAAGPWILAFEIARNPNDRDVRRGAILFASALSIVLGLVCGALGGLSARAFTSASVAAVIALAILLIFVTSPAPGFLQGEGRFRALAGYRAVEAVAKIGLGTGAVALGYRTAGGIAGFVGSGLVMAIIGWRLLRGDIRGSTVTVRAAMERPSLWRRTAGLAGIQALTAIIVNLDTVLVAVLPRESSYAATYQVSVVLSRGPLFASVAISMVAFRLISSGSHTPRQVTVRTLILFCAIAAPAAIAVAALPAHITNELLPGKYHSVGLVLPLTALCGLFYGLVNLLTTYAQAQLRFKAMLCVLASCVGIQAGAIVVGDRLDGPRGVALAALLSAMLAAIGAGAVVLRGARELDSDRAGTHRMQTVSRPERSLALPVSAGDNPRV